MIEFLIISACLYGTPEACENASVAYYKSSGVEFMIQDQEQYYKSKYPLTTTMVAYAGVAFQQKVIVNIGGGRFASFDPKQNIIGYKFTF